MFDTKGYSAFEAFQVQKHNFWIFYRMKIFGFWPSLRSVYFDTDKWKIMSVFETNPLIKAHKQKSYNNENWSGRLPHGWRDARDCKRARWGADYYLQLPFCCLPSNRNWWHGIIFKAWEGDFMTYYFKAINLSPEPALKIAFAAAFYIHRRQRGVG